MRFSCIVTGLLLAVLVLVGCKEVRKITDTITNPSAREVYARSFTEDSTVYVTWQKHFRNALRDSIEIDIPYTEKGIFVENENNTRAYRLFLEEGTVLNVHLDTLGPAARILIDLFKTDSTANSGNPLASNDPNSKTLVRTIEANGFYQLVVQPGIVTQGNYSLRIFGSPALGFPVAGRGNRSIQSLWGMARDGGARSHEGVDIFASRGTPVLAATDGRVSFTGNRGLGGKQVWLRDGIFGRSLYYAHLDSILVSMGSKVNLGDTLGLVGNTGNARTTAPHLHFGIYKRGRGAINPLPFIQLRDTTTLSFEGPTAPQVFVSGAVANLRQSPTTKGLKIGTAQRNDTLSLLGQTPKWGHVRLISGKRAYIHNSLIEPL